MKGRNCWKRRLYLKTVLKFHLAYFFLTETLQGVRAGADFEHKSEDLRCYPHRLQCSDNAYPNKSFNASRNDG
jgi:hypothetical protein